MCPSCGLNGETLDHLFITCHVSEFLWSLVARWCWLVFPSSSSIKEWLSWVDDQVISQKKRFSLLPYLRVG